MARFLIRRVAAAVATLLAASLIIYTSLYLAPGNALGFLLGGRSISDAGREQLEAQYHLNEPFFARFFGWLGDAVQGDFGISIIYKQDVWTLLGSRVGVTCFLVVYAAILILVFGVGFGAIAGVRRGGVDTGIIVVTTVGLAVPSFVAAVVLISVFAVNLGWFPILGDGEGFVDRLWHLTLPAIALSLAPGAYVSRVTRAAVREAADMEYVETARSRGLADSAVLRRHILRNAMIPVVTVGGVTIAGLIAGTVVVETAFDLNGLGSFLVQAVEQKDFPVVQAIVLIIVGVFVILNTAVDVLYSVLDPRIQTRGPA